MRRLNSPVLLVLLMLVAACGDGGTTTPTTPPPPAPPPPPPPPPPANRAPTASGTIGDHTQEAGVEVTVDVSGAFSDPDGNALTYTASSGNSDVATVSVSGSDVTVSGVAAGTATITVTATDPGGLSASQTFDVTVEAANQPPAVVDAIEDQTVKAGAEVTVDVSAAFSDPDGDDLTYEATSDTPDIATASVSGSEVTVGGVAAGTATVTVTATDPGGLSGSQTFTVTVEAASDANQAPATAAAIEDQTVEAGAEVTVDVSAAFSDPDGDDLTYDATSDALDVATASVSGSEVTVNGVAAGTATVTVTATDPGGLSASQTFDVTVEAAGTPDLDVLFAPPTAAEIAQVEADWATREPEVSGVNVELDMVATVPLAGTLRVRVFSHTVGGIRHYGAVATPPEHTEAGSLPVVVVAHGETAGADGDRALQMNLLLGLQGLTAALVIPSYRSEPLRIVGREFLSEGPASPWDLAVDDVLSFLSVALEEVEELDGERIAVLGDKGGGAVGLLAAARDDRIDVVVEISGPTDFFGEYGREVFEEALAGELRDLAGLEDLNEVVIQPWNRGELSDAEARLELVRRSPVYFVDRMPPVQLHHATGDMVVAVSQAERLIDAMDTAGKTEAEFEHHLHDGDSHGFQSLIGAAGSPAIRFARPFLEGR